ncbi:MAG: TonB-dependent receptor [Marinicaulis sp.]|nr:TonB-dependent receptor [Marinicaulis sp.]
MKIKQKMAVQTRVLMAGAAIAALSAGAAQAQGDVIIVTATKRPQTLQEVPIAVSVVGADAIEKAHIQDLFDLQASVPSLRINQLQNASQANFFIRGFGNGANNPGIESSVGVFIDGVYRSRSAAAILDLPVLERVEVLRGPQSTLFGKNVSAGAISITTKAPDFEFGGAAEATYGNFNQMLFKGTLTGPLSDTLAFRISGSTNNQDGYYTNQLDGSELNERDRWAVRGDLLFEPTDALSVRVSGDYNKIDEICCGTIQLQNGPATLAIGAPPPFGLGILIDPAGDRDFSVAIDEEVRNSLVGKGASIQVDYDLGAMALTSITSYREQSDNTQTDADFSAAAIATNPQTKAYETFTQEVRLASTGDNAVDWLIGGFYFDEEVNSTRDVVFGDDARNFFNLLAFSPAILAAAPATGGSALTLIEASTPFPIGTFFTPGTGIFGEYMLDNRSYSLFGQLDIDITDRLTLSGGVAYINDRKRYTTNETLTDQFSAAGVPLLIGVGNGVIAQGALAATLAAPPFNVDVSDPANIAAFAAGNAATFAAVQAGAQAFADANDTDPAVNPLLGLSALQLFANPVNVPDATNPLDDGLRQDDKVTYTVRLAYELNDNLNTYFTYSKGWKAAAVNLSSDTRPPDPVTGFGREANPEDVTLYEFGLKASFDGGFINFAVFDQTIENFQSNLFVGTSFVLANAEEQRVRGFEVDSSWRPFNPLLLTFGLTYLDPEFKSFTNAPCSTFAGLSVPACAVPGATSFDASGFRPAGISPLSISTSATFTQDIGENIQGYVRGESLYEGGTQVVDNVSESIAGRTVENLNISAGLAFDSGIEISAFVRNAFDNQWLLSAFPSVAQPGSFTGYLNEPRTYGVTLRASF